MEYGLIGKTLGHSFSKPVHEALGGYTYELKESAVRGGCARVFCRAQLSRGERHHPL